ncbi:cyclodeaminase/cyclohydrolase family protein [Clostridium thermarum]|uniref:cyclodeaminase/cyclohydrolase family protein n=1 Tax=Clostridium thermarum TaxID=1716543 RepID=UPI0013D41CF1|nr:cyclodeaminase/cyclohydrolase family protein [Clostridium thermarum]
MDFKNDTIYDFVDKLASSSPVPGGGGAAALTAALSSALGSMVFNLTIGKKFYEALDREAQERIEDALVKCNAKFKEFLEYINKDGEAFSGLMEAYKLPKATTDEVIIREKNIQKSLVNAMMVPYKLAEETVNLMDYILIAAKYGNPNVISDAGVGAILAYATVESCILNVRINVKLIKNDMKEILDSCNTLRERAEVLKKAIMDKVNSKI